MNIATPNPIRPEVTLRELVSMMDAHAAELVNPSELYPHLVAAVGKFRASYLTFAAMMIITVRDDARISDCTPRELLAGIGGVFFLLISFLASGRWHAALLGMAAAFGTVALCNALGRKYQDGDL
jgi:hypothetical protein